MKIGIIGTGSIGATLTRKLSAAGHAVQIANTRGPASVAELAEQSGASAAVLDEIGCGVEVLITSIPFARMPELKPIIDRLPLDVPVADTSNYFPRRDGRIEEIDSGIPDGVWIEQQLGRPVVRAWNSLLQTTLANKGTAKGGADRLAVPVAATAAAAKQVVMGLVDNTGFDPIDAGTVDDSWRMQAGAPAYCTELTADQLHKALTLAERDAVSVRREAVLAIIGSWEPDAASFFQDVLSLNRAAAGLHRLLGTTG